jgi:hypothetical protein
MAELTTRKVAARTVAAGALAGAVVAGVVAAAADSGNSNTTFSSAGSSSQVSTAPVVRTDLSTTVQVGGSIGYDGSDTIAVLGGDGGVYTWLPQLGQVIKQGQPLYSVSSQPVPLLYGTIPAYRTFSVGMSDGPDVGQLTRNLIALGYGAGLTQSNHYSSATAAAVERWPVSDRPDRVRRGVLRARPDPGRLGRAVAWHAGPGRGQHRADGDEPDPCRHR